jgi:hypothetical protein
MVDRNTSRRRFLVAAISCSGLISTGMGAALLRAGSVWAQSSAATGGDSAGALARMARLLYPHDDIADDVYAEVIDRILTDAAGDPAMIAVLDTAMNALNSAQDTDWYELGVERQVASLQAVQNEAFFTVIQAGVRDRFYTHPKVWEHIGYPGSSVEHGGYVERGFDDIDWLPEEA